jgi:cell division protein FtsI/penicillin-binding protein 2
MCGAAALGRERFTMKRASAICVVAAALLLPPYAAPPVHAGSSAEAISRESAARLLERRFSASGGSYALMDASTGAILASNLELDRPRPLGSLLKPFTAIAYGETHSFEFPQHECTGKAGGCWRPRGHGRISIVEAIAYSCNAYFRALAADLSAQDVSSVLERFGLDAVDPHAGPPALFGMGDSWRATPRELLRAYLELARRSNQPGAHEVVQGMRLSAQRGTGEALGYALNAHALNARSLNSDALVKTGTATCTHARRAPGDGYAVAIYPADAPQFALLVSLHSAPGSHAAAVAGEMLRALTERR